MIEVSIVAPMHNEASTAQEFVSRVDAALKAMNCSYEIIIINDGSSDNTEAILTKIAPDFPNMNVLCLANNSGQWAAMYAGIQESKGRYVVVMDSDLQNLPEEIHVLVEKMAEGYEIVSGIRQNRQESKFLRLIPSKVANWLLRKITGCPAKDMGGFKCIDGNLARSLRIKAGQHRFLPALVWLRGGRVGEAPVSFPARQAGSSHYGFSRTFDVLFDIVLLWLQNSFKSRPIYLFGLLSLWSFLISTALLLWVTVEKLVCGIAMTNRPAFFVGISGYFAVIAALAFGFVLEVTSDILTDIYQKKPYYVAKRIQGDKTTAST